MNKSNLSPESLNSKFTCSNLPDSIAHELESEDEYFYWTEEGTLISEDGKKTIPSSASVKKPKPGSFGEVGEMKVRSPSITSLVSDSEIIEVRGDENLDNLSPSNKEVLIPFKTTNFGEGNPMGRKSGIPASSTKFRIDSRGGVNAIAHQNQEYSIDKSSLSIIMSSLNLMLLFWFWLQFGN